MLRQIKTLIFQEDQEETEAKQVCVLLRLTAIAMCAYFLCLFCIFIAIKNPAGIKLSLLAFLLFGAVCYGTYRCSAYRLGPDLITGCTFLLMAAWITLFFFIFGWNFGSQHFVFVLVLMAFTIYRSSLKGKFAIALLDSFLWIFLFIYHIYYGAWVSLDTWIINSLHIVNTFFVFVSLSAIMLAYTKESLEMEQQLVYTNEKLKQQASIDPLTGLLNRRSMQEYLAKEVDAYHEGTLSHLSLAIGDIDFFKRVNDVYGHECGDIVLKSVAALFRQTMDSIGAVSRWGGEEFLFSFHDYSKDDALAVLQELQQRLAELEIPYKNNRLKITVTFGLVEFDYRHNMDYSINEADKKLYCGKESGRNRIIH